MSTDPDHSGDYGYDLAHEVRSAIAVPSPRRPLRVAGTERARRELDPRGDLGYDLVDEG